MPYTEHQWKQTPIATLKSEFWDYDTQWHGNTKYTFNGGLQNLLHLQVECKSQKPYGGTADYLIKIDKKVGDEWQNIITDRFWELHDPQDDSWHKKTRNYMLTCGNILAAKKDVKLEFRISTQIQGPGSLPTGGAGSGSYGDFGPPETRVFIAIFKKPSLSVVKKGIESYKKYLDKGVASYR